MTTLTIGPGMTLPLDMVTEPIGVLANRGRGKSSTARVIVEEAHAAGVPVVVLDVKGDWHGIRSPGRGPGLPFYIFGGDQPDLPLEPTAGEVLADLVIDERVSVVLDMSHLSKTKARSFTVTFAERLYRRNRETLLLVVDEADVLIPERKAAETARLLGAMEDLGKRGRSRGIGMVVVTQRPQEVAKSVLDLMDTLILLGMTGPRSIKAVKEWIGVHVDENTTTAEVMTSLPSLAVGQAWVWSPMRSMLKQVRVRRINTFDSHATPRPGQVAAKPKARATVDLDALGERIAATRERAKADDPKALRQTITALERQLAEACAITPVPIVETVEVPVIPDDLVARLEATFDHLSLAYTEWAGELQQASALADEAIEQIVTLRSLLRAAEQAPPPKTSLAGRTHDVRVGEGATRARERPQPRSRVPREGPRPTAGQGADVQLKAGARRILETLARHHPMRVTRSQLGTLAKFKVTGGTFQTYWSLLKRHGLVDETGGDIGITQAGLDYVGADVPEPLTTEQLLDQWRTALKAGARRMLDELVRLYPDGLTRGDLALSMEMAVDGGTFQTYLSTLRRNGLVHIDGGEVRASETLFLGGAR